ncbi:ankyrin repeat domain-containing protein [Haloferula chungangensis]|uniref:Ankyrin repeat domain-containing protein n=1 Tax=Haloferula chungangensis TaxID=1048331 RepID=A0ABW2L3A8_9BACT
MKTFLVLLCLLPFFATAEPDLRVQLRDALYAEEVEREPAKAAESYQKILANFDQQRPLAASALFRLAEVRRAQQKNDEAIALYQRLLREFPDFEREAELSREHLATLGGEAPDVETNPDTRETIELRRLKELAKSAPDIIRDPKVLSNAVDHGWPEVIRYLLSAGVSTADTNVLADAASVGRLDLCKILIEHGKFSESDKLKALKSAIERDRVSVLTYLLKSGVNPNEILRASDNSDVTLLHLAVLEERPEMITTLLDHGADIDINIDTQGRYNRNYPFGTPLHQAVLGRNPKIVKLLLDRGASPDLPAPDTNLTPLHFAISDDHEESELIVSILLEKGADPNRRTGPVNADINKPGNPTNPYYPQIFNKVRPLQLASLWKSQTNAKALIKAGAEVLTEDLAGANSKELLILFLKHTPRFQPDDSNGQDLLSLAIEKDSELAKLLIAHGAAPSEALIKSRFAGVNHEFLPELNKNYLLPKLTRQDSIQLLVDQGTHQDLTALAEPSTGPTPPPLAQALRETPMRFPQVDNKETHYRWLLWRQSESGKLESILLNFEGSDSLPELEWGDVIERQIGSDTSGYGISYRDDPPPSLLWDLTRRIDIPFTITINGQARKITVRGDLLSYDPTKPEVPYLSTPATILLLKPDLNLLSENEVMITIQRDGWQDMATTLGSKTLDRFKLRPGDRLSLDVPPLTAKMDLEIRSRLITLRVPEIPYEWHFETPPHTEAQPSLIEILAQVYSCEKWGFTRSKFQSIPDDPRKRPADILANQTFQKLANPVVLPHPDFSHIRIQRTAWDGSQSTIEVNLTEAIDACDESSTAEQIRESDIPLHRGDIIELPLKREASEWTGFSSKQILFFHKALSGDIMISYHNGEVTQHRIDWQASRWTPSPSGLLPLPPKNGTSSTRALDLGFNRSQSGIPNLTLTRGKSTFGDVGFQAYLRNGDRVAYGSDTPIDVPERSSPDRGRVQRPRIVVPASSTPQPRVRRNVSPSR